MSINKTLKAYIYADSWNQEELDITFKVKEGMTYHCGILLGEVWINMDETFFPEEDEWEAMKMENKITQARASLASATKMQLEAEERLNDLLALPAPMGNVGDIIE